MPTKKAVKPARKPKLGQNFLADRSAAVKIVEALGEIGDQMVIEIGPGHGALTEMLAARAGRLVAIELDRMLSTELRAQYARNPKVQILEGDVLKMDFSTIVSGDLLALRDRQAGGVGRTARVVGNLPYYITSDILLRLFQFHWLFDVVVIMVQREVADRVAAKPGSRDYGLLSATAQLYAKVEKLFTLPPEAFSPPPKVHSSVLRLMIMPQFQELGVDAAEFDRFLKLSFGQKRKTWANNLKGEYDEEQVRAALKSAGVRPDARAETVALEKMAAVWKAIAADAR